MSIYSRSWSGRMLTKLTVALTSPLLSVMVFADAPDFTQMTDQELVTKLHEPAARQELQDRIERYPSDKSRLLQNMAALSYQNRGIPEDLSRKELISLLGYWRNNDLPRVVAKRLAQHYAASTAEARAELFDDVLEFGLNEMGRSPNLVLGNNIPESTLEYDWYARHAASIFPEKEAVELLKDMYFDEDFHSIERFVRVLSTAVERKSAYTAQVLQEILAELPDNSLLDIESIEQAGSIRRQIRHSLGDCGDAGLEVLKTADWLSHTEAIAAIGHIGTKEAEAILLDGYNTADPRMVQARLDILLALSSIMVQTQDEELRNFLRQELPRFFDLDTSGNSVSRLRHAAAVAKRTRDSYFVPHLERLLHVANAPAIENAIERTLDSDEEWNQRVGELEATAQEAIDAIQRSTANGNSG